jgi:hypothetical protein
MPFCTIVEFAWDQTFSRQQFTDMMDRVAGADGPVEGRLSRIVGVDDDGARMIEVWRSSDDARAFAEKSGPALAEVKMPPPSRVTGFETTDFVVNAP